MTASRSSSTCSENAKRAVKNFLVITPDSVTIAGGLGLLLKSRSMHPLTRHYAASGLWLPVLIAGLFVASQVSRGHAEAPGGSSQRQQKAQDAREQRNAKPGSGNRRIDNAPLNNEERQLRERLELLKRTIEKGNERQEAIDAEQAVLDHERKRFEAIRAAEHAALERELIRLRKDLEIYRSNQPQHDLLLRPEKLERTWTSELIDLARPAFFGGFNRPSEIPPGVSATNVRATKLNLGVQTTSPQSACRQALALTPHR